MSTEQSKPSVAPASPPRFKLSLDWLAVITALIFALLILLNVITISW